MIRSLLPSRLRRDLQSTYIHTIRRPLPQQVLLLLFGLPRFDHSQQRLVHLSLPLPNGR
jgi:hypothetical protein